MRKLSHAWMGVIVSIFCSSIWLTTAVQAKSVFAVAGHNNGKIKAYDINGDLLDFQATIPHPLAGATGLCLWPSKDRMFVTYEGSGIISWASIKQLTRDSAADNYETGITTPGIPGGNGLGGMVVDETKGVMYVLYRGTNRLFAFEYDEIENTLVPVPLTGTTDYVELSGISYGMDVDLDETGSTMMGVDVGRLYVSDMMSNEVRYYTTTTWDYEGSVLMANPSIGIELDIQRQYLYSGFFNGGTGENHLMRFDLSADHSDPNNCLVKDLDGMVMDIAVDDDTGYIYMTSKTMYDGRDGAVMICDPSMLDSSDPNDFLLGMVNDSDFGGQNNGPAGIAVGPQYKPSNMNIAKTDDVADGYCVTLDGQFTYTISYGPAAGDETNVLVTDYLPQGVDFVSADPNSGVYDADTHTYVWNIGTVSGSDPNAYLDLTVEVNDLAEPGGTVLNYAEVESDNSYARSNDVLTDICCWDTSGIIYVDASSPGPHIGTCWERAYDKLEDALDRAAICGGNVWVASGTYSPDNASGDGFVIYDDISVYGGFAGYGAPDPDERDWLQNKTILDGEDNYYDVVTMGDGSLINGFTIKGGYYDGITGSDADFAVANCSIKNNRQNGIYVQNGNVIVAFCRISDNGYNGIRLNDYGYNHTLTLENSKISYNGRNGIYCYSCAANILNSEVYSNGSDGTSYYGINLYYSSSPLLIRNCTIVNNANEGISQTGSVVPYVINCIVWNNNADQQYAPLNGTFDVSYSCANGYGNDPNHPEQPDASGNFGCDPNFAYPNAADPNLTSNFHLAYNSICRDAGNSSVVDPNDTGEYDIDKQARDADGYVDIGADEVTCSDVAYWLDANADGCVDYSEFARFANSWQKTENDTGWDDTYSRNNYVNVAGELQKLVDIYDLEFLGGYDQARNHWLWQACWLEGNGSVYDRWVNQDQQQMMMATASSLSTEPAQPQQFFTSQDIINFFYDLMKDDDAMKVINRKDLEKFLRDLEKDLQTQSY